MSMKEDYEILKAKRCLRSQNLRFLSLQKRVADGRQERLVHLYNLVRGRGLSGLLPVVYPLPLALFMIM